jgi:ATP-dependent protease ClpP protease subunit
MKDTINVKSNGIRNELKEIRKSIDKLTDAILQQTNKRNEIINSNFDADDFLRVRQSHRKIS